MHYRSQLFLLIILLAVFFTVKLDVPRRIQIILMNLIYGEEMRNIHALHVVVDPLMPELEREGLTQAWFLQNCVAKMEKAGLKNLTEEEWQQTPGKPTVNITVNATKTENEVYQYSIVLDVEKSELQGIAGAYAQKVKTIWSASGMGEGGVSEIRAKMNEVLELFLKSHAGD